MAKLLGALALYSRIWNNYKTVAVCTWQNYSEHSLFIRESGTIIRTVAVCTWQNYSEHSLFIRESGTIIRTVALCTNGKITRSTRSLFENLNIHKNQGFVSRFCEGRREQLLIMITLFIERRA